nr:MAG TPA: hypothetical protein [Caudoviricetes sp.]
MPPKKGQLFLLKHLLIYVKCSIIGNVERDGAHGENKAPSRRRSHEE